MRQLLYLAWYGAGPEPNRVHGERAHAMKIVIAFRNDGVHYICLREAASAEASPVRYAIFRIRR